MKCTNRNKKNVFQKKRRKRRIRLALKVTGVLVFGLVVFCSVILLLKKPTYVKSFETEYYKTSICQGDLIVDELCVTSQDVLHDDYSVQGEIHAVGLFDLDGAEVIHAQKVHDRLYPASTTKLLTAYLALKYGNLDDIITVSSTAVGVPLDSSRAGLYTGDQVTLETLLYGLMLPSGNDSAVAIAEYISGTESEFAALMNEEARKLGATNSHFVNAHGYHDSEHYTTAYDLYIIMKECLTQDKLIEIISCDRYSTRITQKNGTYREVTWNQTNRYVTGMVETPQNITVLGGKTGTTDEAGACLVLCEKSKNEHTYISIVMGADNRLRLYHNMSGLMSLIRN